MTGYTWLNFLIYSIINAFTPGPGNILALNTVSNYGWRKGRPLFIGIFIGYYVVQIICAVFVYGIGTFLPKVLSFMKYIGAAYIFWLAIHIAISKPDSSDRAEAASFLKGFLLQFVNIKIYMFGITALTSFVTPYNTSFRDLLGCELLIASIGTIATTCWIGTGILFQKMYSKYYRVINILLSLTLIECIWSILK